MSKTEDRISKLTSEIAELRSQLSEYRETLEAIRSGKVDALVVQGTAGEQVFTLKDSEHPYRVMVETMNEGAATITADGTIFYCNQQLASLLNLPLNKIIGLPLSDFIVPDHVPVFRSVLQRAVLSTGRAEIEMKTGDSAPIPVLLSARALYGENRQMLSLVITDLSEHKRTEQVMASERFARTILDQAADAVIVCDTEGTIIRASARAHNLFGINLEGWKFDRVFDHFYPVTAVSKLARRDFAKEPVSLSALYREAIPPGSEIALIKDDQAKQSFVLNFSPLTEEGDLLGYSISLTDITQRRQMEEALAKARDDLEIKVKERTAELSQANEQLKDYARRITQVQEDERKRLAYELHDDTAQYLSILKLQMGSLLTSGKIQDPEIVEKLKYLEKDAGRAVDDVRRFSHELRPAVLDRLGLPAALEQIAEDFNKLKQITVKLAVEGEEPKLPDEVNLAFFRITQEALNNIRKHARGSEAVMKIIFQENQVRMEISDNGSGFDVEETRARAGNRGSLGLMSMQERAQLIGASLRIESAPGKGTTVSVEMPL